MAYRTLGRVERRTRHLAAARYLESLGDEELASVVASHYLEAVRATPTGQDPGGLVDLARDALRVAGDRAMALHSRAQAFRLYSDALSIATEARDRADLSERAARAAWTLADASEADRLIVEAAELFRSVGDADGDARARTSRGRWMTSTRHPDRAISSLLPLAEAAGERLSPAVESDLMAELGRAYWLSGRAREALPWLDRALEIAETNGVTPVLADALDTKAVILAELGSLDEGLDLLRRSIELARESGSVEATLRAQNNYASMNVDDPVDGLTVVLEALATAERIGHRDMIAQLSLIAVLWEALVTGDIDGAEPRLERLAGVQGAHHASSLEGRRAIAAASRGDRERAIAALERAAAAGEQGSVLSREDLELSRVNVDLLDGALDRAYAGVTAVLPSIDFMEWRVWFLMPAIQAAVVSRRADWLDAIAGEQERIPLHGRWVDAYRDSVAGARAVLAGDAGGGAALERAEATFRAIGAPLEIGKHLIRRVALLGSGDPAGAAAADEARAIFERLGMPPYLRMLEGVERPPSRST